MHRFLPALAACALTPLAAQASLVTTTVDVDVPNLLPDDNGDLTIPAGNSAVVASWTAAKGSAPVDAANNLLQTHVSSVTLQSGEVTAGGALANINDGLMVSGTWHTGNAEGGAVFTDGSGWNPWLDDAPAAALVFTLDGKYNIGRIDSFTLWGKDRLGQKYELFGSTNGGTDWNSVTSVNSAHGDYEENGTTTTLRGISLTDSAGVITGLTGVDALKFVFANPDPGSPDWNNMGVYSEIAAYSLTAVPEPGSLLALGCLIGSGAFLRSRRR